MQTDATDADLLRRYVEDRSEAAFGELVARHLNLVYFAALRQVGGDGHRAREVAQTVFTDLAWKARSLAGRPTLTGWLHTSTRFAAAHLRRAALTRQRYEQEAITMQAMTQEAATVSWERVRPVIDDAIHTLGEQDREAVLLRFFEGRAFAEIGAALRLSEDAARMRVERALDKLRSALARRGVDSTSAALAVAFANQAGAAAPAGLAAALATGALAATGGAVSVAATGGLAIFMSKTSTVVVGAVALAALSAAFWQWQRAPRASSNEGAAPVGSLRATASLSEKASSLDKSGASPTRPLTARTEKLDGAAMSEEARREMMVRVLTNGLRVIAQVRDESGQALSGMKDFPLEKQYSIGLLMHSLNGVMLRDTHIPMTRGAPITATTRYGVAVTYDPNGANASPGTPTPEEQRMWELWPRVEAALSAAVEAYMAANGGKDPADAGAFAPYFATSELRADFVTFMALQKQIYDALNLPVKEPEPKTLEERIAQLNRRVTPALTQARSAYMAANGGKAPPRREDLLPYFATPETAAVYVEYLAAVQERTKQKEIERQPKTPEEFAAEQAFQDLARRVSPKVEAAKLAYSAANGGKSWENWKNLLPYLTPEDAAEYTRLVDELDKRMERERERNLSGQPPEMRRYLELMGKNSRANAAAEQAYRAANPDKKSLRWQDVLPYFATTEQAADYAEMKELQEKRMKR